MNCNPLKLIVTDYERSPVAKYNGFCLHTALKINPQACEKYPLLRIFETFAHNKAFQNPFIDKIYNCQGDKIV